MSVVRIAFLGAGGVNFGGHGNAWDHASRLELLPQVEFVGITDISRAQAEKVLAIRKSKPEHCHKWENAQIFCNYEEMIQKTRPTCIFLGLPPFAHGSNKAPIEAVCAEAKVHLFIEKPVGCAPPEEMVDVINAVNAATENGLVVSVAYMFRYSKIVRKAQELIKQFGPVRMLQARYHCAYSQIGRFWFDMAQSGGPIIEQATHFLDLARLLCGEVIPDTVTAHTVRADHPLGQLSALSVDESSIPVERRVPRVTNAIWTFKSGCIGTLVHTVLLHGCKYDSEIELLGDGYRILLQDPYHKCQLSYRAPGSEDTVTVELPDDPYFEEVETFINACRTRDTSKIASPYADALNTHKLAWAIRRAAESSPRLVASPSASDFHDTELPSQ